MNWKPIIFIGIALLCILPIVGFHAFSLFVAIDTFDTNCTNSIVSIIKLPSWLLASIIENILYMVLSGLLFLLIYKTKRTKLYVLFTVLTGLHFILEMAWSIIGASLLFINPAECFNQSHLLYITVICTIIIQWLTALLSIIIFIFNKCCNDTVVDTYDTYDVNNNDNIWTS